MSRIVHTRMHLNQCLRLHTHRARGQRSAPLRRSERVDECPMLPKTGHSAKCGQNMGTAEPLEIRHLRNK